MPTAPTLDDVQSYMGSDHSFSDDEIISALAAETAAQLRVVRLPADPDPLTPSPYPFDLAEALMRRVSRNLHMRQLPLGYQQTAVELGVISTRIGSDPEINRLEAPFRRRTVG